MKTIWCWRCKKNVPMLEEHEYQVISNLEQEYRLRIGSAMMHAFHAQFVDPCKLLSVSVV